MMDQNEPISREEWERINATIANLLKKAHGAEDDYTDDIAKAFMLPEPVPGAILKVKRVEGWHYVTWVTYNDGYEKSLAHDNSDNLAEALCVAWIKAMYEVAP